MSAVGKPRFEGHVFNLKYGDTPWTGTELKETGKSSEAK
jgi:hypothetical protein